MPIFPDFIPFFRIFIKNHKISGFFKRFSTDTVIFPGRVGTQRDFIVKYIVYSIHSTLNVVKFITFRPLNLLKFPPTVTRSKRDAKKTVGCYWLPIVIKLLVLLSMFLVQINLLVVTELVISGIHCKIYWDVVTAQFTIS